MLKDSVSFELEQESLEKELVKVGLDIAKIKKMKVGKTDKDCSICVGGFTKG